MTSWGLLSTARINRLVLAGARASDRVDVIAVASRERRPCRGVRARARYRAPHGDYDALLADPDVEAVHVSLPNSLHVEWTLRALDAGKHVLCEKPFSRRAADVERAFDVADRAGLVLSEGLWRHHPQTQRLSALVADGAVGRLRIVRAAFSFQLAAVHGADDTRFRPEQDGGALMDVGCYCVNACRLLAGEPERVFAEQVVGETGVDVSFAASLRFPGGLLAHFDCGFVVPYRDELEVVGDQGKPVRRRSLAHPLAGDRAATRARARDGGGRAHPRRGGELLQARAENVSDAIRGESPLLLGRDDAVGQARVIEALYHGGHRPPVDVHPPVTPEANRSS